MGHWEIIAIYGKANEKNHPCWGGYDWGGYDEWTPNMVGEWDVSMALGVFPTERSNL